jgi:hypothetical protein
MLRFFRTMRQALVPENRFGRYFLYAVGEILLVVVGILIALQVNKWNESQKLKKEELTMLNNLEAEFFINMENLQNIQLNNENVYDCAVQLKELIGKNESEIHRYNVDSLLYISILIADFQPNHFVLSHLKSTDKLELISSVKLKRYLYEWENALNRKTEAFNMWNTYYMNSLIPFLDENASVRNLDYYGGFPWSSLSPLEHDPFGLFQMIQFDNRLENHTYCIHIFSESIDDLLEIAEEINAEIIKEKTRLNLK